VAVFKLGRGGVRKRASEGRERERERERSFLTIKK
jgi:hypothetical protein